MSPFYPNVILYCFSVAGCLGVLWYIAWAYLVYETPLDHPTISKSELDLIQDSVGQLSKTKVCINQIKNEGDENK